MQKAITFVVMMFIIASGTSFSQDKQDWKFMHPTPHNNNLRKIKMIDENTWVAVGGNGTYMQTTNSGANWYFHHFAGKIAPTLATSNAFDAWFFDKDNGVVVGDQGYIGRTFNGGVTLDSVGLGLVATNSRCWSVWFADANTGYIGAGSQSSFTARILKTTNGGVNWTTVYSSAVNYVTALGGIDAQTVVASFSNGTTLRTTDGGTIWNETPSALFSIPNNITFLNSTTGFAAGSGGQVKRSTDAGVSWVSVNTPQTDWSLFQLKAVSATEIYAIGDPSFIYKSTNLGDNWSALPISVSGPATTFIWYSLDFYGSTYVLSGDYGIVAKSTDGCATWSSNSVINSTALMYDITTVPGTGKYWIVGRPNPSTTTKQIMYSSNSGNNWVTYDLNVTGDFLSISMVNENTGYVSGQNSQVMKTTDGGVSWVMKPKPSVTNYQLYTCKFVDENTGWVFVNFSTVPGGNIFKTTNGGDNWTQYTTGQASENIYGADMIDANTGWCFMNTSNRPVYKTTNGGVNWTAQTTGLTGSIRGISSPDGNTVYACQTSGTSRVAKSTNGGTNWTLITLPVAADFTSIDFKDVNTGYTVGNNTAAVARTTNGGASWTFQHTHNITAIKTYVTQGDTAWVLGGNRAVMRYVGANASPIKVNLTMLMEGMYQSGTNLLSRKDPVTVYLRDAVSPYSLRDSATAVIDSVNHNALFTFANAPSGQYYLVVKHWNTLETWSRSGGEVLVANGTTYNYDFTTAANKAFGSNQVLKGVRYCVYSGDVNNDDIVDITDLAQIDNDVAAFVTGYVITDLDGDNNVDISDLAIADNNVFSVVSTVRP